MVYLEDLKAAMWDGKKKYYTIGVAAVVVGILMAFGVVDTPTMPE